MTTRLTHSEKEILRPVIRRYAEWPDAHDGPVFEAVEEILMARFAKVQAYADRCAIMRVEPSTQGLKKALEP